MLTNAVAAAPRPLPPSPEGDLVAGLRARDPGAARAAWSLLSPQVKHVIGRFRHPDADREDLQQEVFLRFFTRIDELRNPLSLRSFLFGISLGVAQNERRRARVRRPIELTPFDELPEPEAAPQNPEAREAARRLASVLACARPDDRRLFLRRYLDGLELAELAEAEGVSLSTVRRHLARATRRIQTRLRADPALADLAAQLSASRSLPARRAG